MKNLLVILIVFSTMLTKQSEYISIEHIGISDKPIVTIIISKDNIVNTDTENFKVTNEGYATLRRIMVSNSHADYKGAEFGSFKITMKNISGKKISYCLNRLKSIELLNILIKAFEKENVNNDLLASLETVKKRIVY